jgi:hypothetical protein
MNNSFVPNSADDSGQELSGDVVIRNTPVRSMLASPFSRAGRCSASD